MKSPTKIIVVAAATVGIFAPAFAQEAKPAPAPKAAAKQPSAAAPKPICVSNDEAVAFRLRHLQSRLMVAALSCGQKEAYNTFVTANMGTLNAYGPNLISYYKRAGGSAALNRYVTDLANAAASIRSEDPVAFCTHTWNVFLELLEQPAVLLDVAASNPLPAISQPSLCAVPAEKPAAQQVKAPVAPKPAAQQAKAQ